MKIEERTEQNLRYAKMIFAIVVAVTFLVAMWIFLPVLGKESWSEALAGQKSLLAVLAVLAIFVSGLYLLGMAYNYCLVRPKHKKWAVWGDTMMRAFIGPIALTFFIVFGLGILLAVASIKQETGSCSEGNWKCEERNARIQDAGEITPDEEEGWMHGILNLAVLAGVLMSFGFSGQRVSSRIPAIRYAHPAFGVIAGVGLWGYLLPHFPVEWRLLILMGISFLGINLVVGLRVLCQEIFTPGYQYPWFPEEPEEETPA